MAFKRQNGDTNFQGFAKAASTAMAKDTVVAFNGSGFLVPATAASTPASIAGILQRDVLATDADYAQNSIVPVEVPRQREDRFIVDVEAGTVTQAMVGTRVDLNDAAGLNVAGTTYKVALIEELLSTTRGTASLGQVVVTFPGINAV
jgi:hypothetical protein